MDIRQLIHLISNPKGCESLTTDEVLSLEVDIQIGKISTSAPLKVTKPYYNKDLVNHCAVLGAVVINIEIEDK